MQLAATPVVAIVLAGVFLLMLVELQLSVSNERYLRAHGAIEPPDDVYLVMRLAYPGVFLAMGLEGLSHTTLSRDMVLAGVLLLGWAKALKFWVMSALGRRWSFRVLVLPELGLVAHGPYRFMRHPNYLAVLMEIASVGIALEAGITGLIGFLGFAWILRRRIQVEERALGLR
jgi:methyltransferase